MADTLESLEIQVKHSATGAADEINKVAASVKVLGKYLSSVIPKLKEFSAVMSGNSFTINDQSTTQYADTINNVKQAASGAKSATREASKGISEMSKEASKANKPLGNFIASLKRIAFYRIIRGIIKAITQAISEGLQMSYLFSQGAGEDANRFAASMDKMKASTNVMKGQLGSAFISLLAAIQPILLTLIDLVTKAADAIAQFFAAFTGNKYIKATETSAQFAQNMKAGGAAAKEWKNQLLGFDEINRLNEPNQGGGGGGSNPMEGFAFEAAPINEKIQHFVDLLKEKVQPAIDRLKKSFERLKEAWDRFIENFDGSVLEELLADFLALDINAIANTLTVLFDTLTLVLEILNAINTGDWSKVWTAFKQLLYDIIILVMDLFVGITNLVMDALIILVGSIDKVIGTHFADYLIEDKRAFNEMYNASKESTDGLWGLKRELGLTEKATEDLSDESQTLTGDLIDVGSEAVKLDSKVSGVRRAVDWVLDGFRGFGAEVAAIITSLFQPLENLCVWIDSVLQGFGLMKGINARVDAATADGSIYLQGFASGGFPSEGQLFVANEAGAEMVGTIGGRTAVAPSNDIVEAVRQGVYDAVLAANSNGNNDVSVKVYLDSREIRAGQERLSRAWG